MNLRGFGCAQRRKKRIGDVNVFRDPLDLTAIDRERGKFVRRYLYCYGFWTS